MEKSTPFLVALLLIGLGVGGYIVTRDSSKNDTVTQTASDTISSATGKSSAGTENTASAATITYTNSGFTEKTTTIPVGSTVTIKNDSSSDLQFSSDEHPVHTDNTELNALTIGPSESTTITVRRSGTWGFHNHLRDAHSGILVVQ